jgi:hypothetical protein
MNTRPAWSDASLVAACDAIDDITESDWRVVLDVDRRTDNGLRNTYPPLSYVAGFGKPAGAKKIVLRLLTDDRMRSVWQTIDRSLESAHEALIQSCIEILKGQSIQGFDFDPSKFDKDESRIACLIARECVRAMAWTSLADSKAKYTAEMEAISHDLHGIGERLSQDTHFKRFAGRDGEALEGLLVLSRIARLVATHPPDLIRRGGLAQTRKLNMIDGLGQVFLKVLRKPMDSEVADIVSVVTGIEVSATEVKTERTRYSRDPSPFTTYR